MITIHLPDREPLRAFYNSDGRLTAAYAAHSAEGDDATAIARAKGYYEEEYFAADAYGTPSHRESVLHAAVKNLSVVSHAPAVPARSAAGKSRIHLKLVTGRGGNRPAVGYLVPDVNHDAAWVQCLRVAVVTKEHRTSVIAKVSKDYVEVSAGRLRRTALALNPVKVSAKQTPHQRWLTDLWAKVNHAIASAAAPHSAEPDFVHAATSSDLGIEPREILKLAILLHAPYWAAFPVSDEAKLGQLKALGLQAPKTRNALGTIIDRMEVETA